ncbi:hypothetical protein [Paenibacillus thiaminolyticus]|nr:hypothetical protein [Paenibacillus thiaminolyticus]MCY9535517.1 hypothetical protein [Paenibacillus thiaminolyticus]MCY9615839.1 hypothetical protein [Paenibacillus thiaminolyticus]MCY9625670.1 hypothetical protein [Paenibacillus thiaminolyticus]MCY9637341.1 hypothetical protein [Paenibacillus thiaminolyticus]MCY9644918.1 hypothetical protein [Paenibacillus thiaminolyticus]
MNYIQGSFLGGARADVAQIKDIFFIQEAIDPLGLTVEIEGFHVPASLAP